MRNRLLLVFCAFALQNMSGAAAINYYSPTLFASLGIKDVALYTGIYGLVKGKFFFFLFGTIFAFPIFLFTPNNEIWLTYRCS